jgi:PDZ domain
MRAPLIAAILLEEAPRGATVAFGYGVPPQGYFANSLREAVHVFQTANLIPGRMPVQDAVNYLINKYDVAFVIQKEPGDVQILSRSLPLALSKEGMETIGEAFAVAQEGHVAWSRSPDVRAQQVPVAAAFHTETERAKKEHETDRHEQAQAIATRYYAEAQAPAAAVKLGFDMDAARQNGIYVAAVDPNSPASRAGLTAGDTIYQIGPYYSKAQRDYRGPFRLQTPRHLEQVLAELNPDVPVPIQVIRGGGSLKLAIVPEAAAPRQASDQQQTYTNPKTVPGRAPTPASQTGNQPPNVSSLT